MYFFYAAHGWTPTVVTPTVMLTVKTAAVPEGGTKCNIGSHDVLSTRASMPRAFRTTTGLGGRAVVV